MTKNYHSCIVEEPFIAQKIIFLNDNDIAARWGI